MGVIVRVGVIVLVGFSTQAEPFQHLLPQSQPQVESDVQLDFMHLSAQEFGNWAQVPPPFLQDCCCCVKVGVGVGTLSQAPVIQPDLCRVIAANYRQQGQGKSVHF